MIVSNKIHGKSFKHKLDAVLIELSGLIERSGIAGRQLQYAHARMNEYKQLYEECPLGRGICSENAKNTTENAWSQKDLQTLLREKTEQISFLQKIADELTVENAELKDSHKKIRTTEDTTTALADKQYTEDLESENLGLKQQIAQLRRASREVEADHQTTLSRLNLKMDQMKKQLDIIKAKGPPVDCPAEGRPSPRKEEAGANGSRAEIEIYREKILGLSASLATAERTAKNMQEMIALLEKSNKDLKLSSRIRLAAENVQPGSLEEALSNELRTVTEAFDQMMNARAELEQEIARQHRKSQTLFGENAHLKNKIKLMEEAKSFFEKEKQRYEADRMNSTEMEQRFSVQIDELNKQLAEKTQKAANYRVLLGGAEAEIGALTEEVKNAKALYKAVVGELEEAKGALSKLELVNKRQSRMLRSIKPGFADEETEDIEIYRRLLRCSLCDLNLKNSIISKCMHCFCSECIQNHYKSRNRKCPVCELEFNMNDVKRLYL